MPRIRDIVIGLIALTGCSGTQRIADDANKIRHEADLLKEHGTQISDQTVIDGAVRIGSHAADIHNALSNVEDKTPAWMSMVWWVAAAVISVAVVVVLWQTGAGTAIRIAIGWIPRKKIADAELAEAMLDPSKPENPREYVAARRGSDPEFDAALRKLKRKKESDEHSG